MELGHVRVRLRRSVAELAKAHPLVTGIVICAAASAILNQVLARRAERHNRPLGRFVEVGGVRLHYIEEGAGTPVVLLHGNGSMVEDFKSSGLIDMLSKTHRVIAFDRPGFGHSNRPRGKIWTPEAQADLIKAALELLDVQNPVVVGHSWGTLVAIALAQKLPGNFRALVLMSGYYYSTARIDAAILSPPAVPVVGDLLSLTLAPLLGRLLWPLLMRKIFDPEVAPQKFEGFPKEMAVRPSQIRASAAESALMIPAVERLKQDYSRLNLPVVLIAGEADRYIESEQSSKLHKALPQSHFKSIAGRGHMVHQTATAQAASWICAAAADSFAGQDSTKGNAEPLYSSQ